MEVKTVPDTTWQLNDNFTVLGIEGILNMLNGKGCQELGQLHDLATSRDAAVHAKAGGANRAEVVETAWPA
jgi:hypothetical protein